MATAETCNSIDDDCDGVVDNGAGTVFTIDADGDGFGSAAPAAMTRTACTVPTGYSASKTDCNDASAFVNPTATEACDTANVDENCNGMVNEGCGCTNIGQTQPCCSGRGTQTCTAGTLTACSVSATAETCNGIDDNCNGTVDDGIIVSADGGVVLDGGVVTGTGTCEVGLGACRATNGTVSCTGAQFVCSGATPGTPTAETCNGIDDNCNGAVDDGSSLCSVTGQTCSSGSCQCPAGQTVCGSSCQTVGGACSAGVGACARSGTFACTNNALACNAVAGAPGTETCNSIDDNCNGTVDEGGSLCSAVSGQTCSSGACSCPAGQTACGSSCQTLGGTCSAGVGACARSGTFACTNNTFACNAVAGTPGTETCNGIDDNCNGTVDEGGSLCSAVSGQTCSSAACRCPAGQTACGSSCQTLGGTCSAGVGACLRSGTFACTNNAYGCNAVAGAPTLEICDGIDNDCNNQVDEGVKVVCFADTDGDRYRDNTTPVEQCPNVANPSLGNCPTGFVSGGANLGEDCAPGNVNAYRNVFTRTDGDQDRYCVGAQVTSCVGTTAPAGRTFSTSCLGSADDCNDGSATAFVNVQARVDADGDGYCVGVAAIQCTAGSALSGTRLAASCTGGAGTNDCRDTNFFANSSCTLSGYYTTTTGVRECAIFGTPGAMNGSVNAIPFPACPNGFSLTNLRTNISSGANVATCGVVNSTTITTNCLPAALGRMSCNIVGDCAAN